MTECISSLKTWQALRAKFNPEKRIGFVPTMGNLHPGHLSLCKASLKANDVTVVSIFVNPAQFNNKEDFEHYPKTLEADLAQLQAAGVDYCLLPTKEELYHDEYTFRIDAPTLTQVDEGAHRPGHYMGVLTVVMKLFQLVQPHHAYFGEKDFQQAQLITQMAKAFFIPTQIHLCPTVREKSGLAYSSRNQRLTHEGKQKAAEFAQLFKQAHKPLSLIQTELETAGIKVEYLSAHEKRRFAAVYIDGIRLIDTYAEPH